MIKIDNYTLLTNVRTLKKLIEYKKNPTEELRNEIIIGNIKLAQCFCKNYSIMTSIPPEELEGYAYEGLIIAVDNYNIESGKPFSAFLNEIISNLIQKNFCHIFGEGKNTTFFRDFVIAKKIVEKNNQITLEEDLTLLTEIFNLLLEENKIEPDKIKERKNLLAIVFHDSLEQENNKGESLINIIPDNDSLKIEEICMQNDLKKIINDTLEDIKKSNKRNIERNINIVRLKYGLDDNSPRTYDEIVQPLGICIETARLSKEGIIKKLRHPLRTRQYKNYY